eukprot:CAMPEP_0185767184 /NCGR_PEP_ID=MMETSP1174-20130828/41804_1 /TAXON_ID=35687 /ORGANISM="Dictyocha speculum, Strain CCMP1381" /LENGTH=35 /DNA_ID= /DNA_START= /DNA_END= /DNA_ORIENTATION=
MEHVLYEPAGQPKKIDHHVQLIQRMLSPVRPRAHS